MARAAYPTSGDLNSYLTRLNVLTSTQLAALDLAGLTAAASAAWEKETGWYPFLAASSATLRRFDPPGPGKTYGATRGGGTKLLLQGGLAAAPTVVQTGYGGSPTTLVADTDYWLLPYNALAQNLPYTAIEFAAAQYGSARSLAITGRWGWGARVPEDAWQAILQRAASLAAGEIAGSISGGLAEWKEADVSERYGDAPIAAHVERWAALWQEAVSRYRRGA